jgi:hypothetical protein
MIDSDRSDQAHDAAMGNVAQKVALRVRGPPVTSEFAIDEVLGDVLSAPTDRTIVKPALD